jgi:hypothetical protein
MAIWIVTGILLLATAATASAQGGNLDGQGRAVVTVLPGKHSEMAPNISLQDLSIKINGKGSSVTRWLPLRGSDDRLELVVLIDSAARNLSGALLGDIANFIESMSPDTRVAVGYMENGRALLAGPLSADHAQAAHALHLTAGRSDGPYFCLSDLAKNWPSAERGVRREVLLVSGGVDPFNRRYDPDDPYLQAAIADSVRAGLVVYSIYWRSGSNASGIYAQSPGANGASMDQSRSGNGGSNSLTQLVDGESLMAALTQATGGKSYWFGSDNPTSFQPYLDDLDLRLKNQYELGFSAQLNGKPAIETLKLKARVLASEVDAPEQVLVDRAAPATE